MILNEAEIDGLARSREGNLGETPFASLLYALARTERSVTLAISRPPLVKEIVFERGVPVDCRSNLAHETLSRFMQSNALLDEATANECFSEACSSGCRFGDVLIERNLISAEELHKVLQKNLAKKLLDGFSWHQGAYRMSDAPVETDSTLRVNVPQLIVLGVTRFATQEQVDASTGPMIGRELALHPAPFFSPTEIRMTEQQRSIIDRLSARPTRIDQIASATGIPHNELTRTLYALSLIGLVVAADQVASLDPNRPATPPRRPATTPSKQTEEPEPTVDAQRRAELMQLVLNFRRKDAFELLELDPDDFGREAQNRFLAFAERYAPWTYPKDLADDARRVFLAGARAFGELCDPDRRHAIVDRRRQLRSGSATGANDFRIESDLLDPEIQYRDGRAMMAEGNYRGALEQLSYASDLDPQNGTYRAELAYCRYLFNPQAAGPEALVQLKKAERIDPSCGLVHFYLGEILREMGHIDDAREAYRRAIKPMAPDRRPIDALKRLPR